MTTTVVVQARMGSSRLPGKVLADLGGRPVLDLLLDRLAALPDTTVVLATSDRDLDDPVAAHGERRGAAVVRGPEDDVLARFVLALDEHPADVVVRITADCPLVDPAVVAAAVAAHHETMADHTSNILHRTFPDGLDVEVVAAPVLRQAADEAVDPADREHVTPFVYHRPDRFRLVSVEAEPALGRERWTLDTAADLDRLRAIVADLADPVAAGWHEVLAVAGRHEPEGAVDLIEGVRVAEHRLIDPAPRPTGAP